MFSSQNSQVSNNVNYIEDVFSTYLYTGNGSTQTINNGIDLAGKGGLVWGKSRSNAYDNFLADSARGSSKLLYSNNTYAQQTDANVISSFNSNGFSLGIGGAVSSNTNGATYVSWTFREQPKFFDVVTYTGNDAANRQISHNLGSVPGCIIVKATSTTGNWFVYHRSLGDWATNSPYAMLLNTTGASTAYSTFVGNPPTSTTFTVDGVGGSANASGQTYVAYLFAHDAGGFGLTGTDNVISCGTFTNSGSTVNINLGYEAQFVLMKKSSGTGNWFLFDTMRGLSQTSFEFLYPNLSNAAEFKDYQGPYATATGFSFNPVNNGQFTTGDYIYIAIRRGPMKVPTLGTSVFSPVIRTGTGSAASITGIGFPPDWALCQTRAITSGNQVQDKLRGPTRGLRTQDTSAETSSATDALLAFGQDGINVGANTTSSYWNYPAISYVYYYMRRAPGFFDEVCYTGTGSAQNVTHNLTVAPELVIIKSRSGSGSGYDWVIGSSTLPSWGRYLLFATDAVNGSNNAGPFNNTAPTSSVLTVNTWTETNGSGSTYVAYLFATCAGVSKVGSYTGTAALQTIACGFTTGARYVLIKRTDSTGDWYVWDSARGITSGNDPYLLLNSTAAEVTSTNYVDTDSTGFKVTAAAPAGINAVGGNYIFLAIA